MTDTMPLELGQMYHITCRGEKGEKVFPQKRAYSHFLNLYFKVIAPVADTYAYCLLPDHAHFLVRTRTAEEIPKDKEVLEPGKHFAILFDAYTKAINKAYLRSGSLFRRPCGCVWLTSDVHLGHLIAYIHQNPEQHGQVADLGDWPHSSYDALLSHDPTPLKRDEVLAWFDGRTAFQQFHQQPVLAALVAELAPNDFD
jgi:putative transposase